MSDFSQTASMKSPIFTPGGVIDTGHFLNILNDGARRELKMRLSKLDAGCGQLFREETTNQHADFHRTYNLGNKPVALNGDAEEIPMDDASEGFANIIRTFVFRKGTSVTREMLEEMNFGIIGKRVAGLMKNAVESIEAMRADALNRGFGDVDAPFTCEDGGYLFDSARPNPVAGAGTWSNIEAPGALTAEAVFQADLNYKTYHDERGEPSPQELKMIVHRPEEGKTAFELAQSDKRPTDAMNARNWAFGRFQYLSLNRLTTACVIYLAADPKSEENELVWKWFQRPGVKDFDRANNPDVLSTRVRYRCGFGCHRPYIFRGQKLA